MHYIPRNITSFFIYTSTYIYTYVHTNIHISIQRIVAIIHCYYTIDSFHIHTYIHTYSDYELLFLHTHIHIQPLLLGLGPQEYLDHLRFFKAHVSHFLNTYTHIHTYIHNVSNLGTADEHTYSI